jgi:quercetin dioxygenase-like cupin family protein
MQITRNSLDTVQGPRDWFTGAVFIDSVAAPEPPARTGAGSVHFTPGARTHWHTHPFGQTIFVIEGIGRCQRQGGPVEIRPGDRVFFEPEENHWHGAAPNRFMTHIAIQEADENGPVAWGQPVTDDQYLAQPANSSPRQTTGLEN